MKRQGLRNPHSPLMGVDLERLTVWLIPSDGAPGKKRLWVDYDSDDKLVSALPDALLVLGHLAPSFEVPGYVVRLDHDLDQARVSLRLEPRHRGAVEDIGPRSAGSPSPPRRHGAAA